MHLLHCSHILPIESYFQNLCTPKHIKQITAIYIEFQIQNNLYEQHIALYKRTHSQLIQLFKDTLKCQNIHVEKENSFFTIIFNQPQDIIINQLIALQRNCSLHNIHICCGLFTTQSSLECKQLYQSCLQEHHYARQHHSLISISCAHEFSYIENAPGVLSQSSQI